MISTLSVAEDAYILCISIRLDSLLRRFVVLDNIVSHSYTDNISCEILHLYALLSHDSNIGKTFAGRI